MCFDKKSWSTLAKAILLVPLVRVSFTVNRSWERTNSSLLGTQHISGCTERPHSRCFRASSASSPHLTNTPDTKVALARRSVHRMSQAELEVLVSTGLCTWQLFLKLFAGFTGFQKTQALMSSRCHNFRATHPWHLFAYGAWDASRHGSASESLGYVTCWTCFLSVSKGPSWRFEIYRRWVSTLICVSIPGVPPPSTQTGWSRNKRTKIGIVSSRVSHHL